MDASAPSLPHRLHRMLRHYDAVVFIPIEHSVFGCKVRKLKRYVKIGSFRTVTLKFIKQEEMRLCMRSVEFVRVVR